MTLTKIARLNCPTIGEYYSDTLWERLSPELPVHPPKVHPLGCHRRRVPDRQVLDGIFLRAAHGLPVESAECDGYLFQQYGPRPLSGMGSVGVFARLWKVALPDYEDLIGLDFEWLALDGSLHKAPWGGEKTGPNPTDRGKGGTKRSLLTEARGSPGAGAGGG